jgi:hypothetical protein
MRSNGQLMPIHFHRRLSNQYHPHWHQYHTEGYPRGLHCLLLSRLNRKVRLLGLPELQQDWLSAL